MARGKSKKNKQNKCPLHSDGSGSSKNKVKPNPKKQPVVDIMNDNRRRVPEISQPVSGRQQPVCPLCTSPCHAVGSLEMSTNPIPSTSKMNRGDGDDGGKEKLAGVPLVESKVENATAPAASANEPDFVRMENDSEYRKAFIETKVKAWMDYLGKSGKQGGRVRSKSYKKAFKAKEQLILKITELEKLFVLLKMDMQSYYEDSFNECDFEHFYNQKLDDKKWTLENMFDDTMPRAIMLRKHVFMIQMYKQNIKDQMKACRNLMPCLKNQDRAELLASLCMFVTLEKEVYNELHHLLKQMEELRSTVTWGKQNFHLLAQSLFDYSAIKYTKRNCELPIQNQQSWEKMCDECWESSRQSDDGITALSVLFGDILRNYYDKPESPEFHEEFDKSDSVMFCKKIAAQQGCTLTIFVAPPEFADENGETELRLTVKQKDNDYSVYASGPIKESIADAWLKYKPFQDLEDDF